ncbi:hypothetical protein C1H76_8668 [Elsinoe australis]|uniref:Uncharacterized protein n=1 Tax=Elsinoe australis TaxID=40998 RepID=A0A4U7AU34_9PEZI|nr:hypothetical protein C1H76_8668 [Elsinoe australis]
MGFLSRSKSLRRQQSTLNTSRSDRSEEERFYKQRQEQRSAVNVNVTQEFDVRSARLDPRHIKDPPRPGTANRPTTANGKSQRSNPLPTPDKGPSYRPDTPTKVQTIEIQADSLIYRFPTPSPGTPRGSVSHTSHASHTSSDATIGIALGSPRLPPQHIPNSPRALPEAPRASPLRTFSEPARTPLTATPITPTVPEPTKLRKSKSRSFKNMFSSKSNKPDTFTPPVPPSHWQTSINASRDDISRSVSSNATSTTTSQTSNASNSTKASTVSNTSSSRPVHSRNDSTHARAFARQQVRADLDKAHFEASKAQAASQSKTPKPTGNMQIFPTVQTLPPVKRSNYTEIRIPSLNQDALDKMHHGPGPGSGLSQSASSSFLNVYIPKSEMERYSVMFEKLLKPSQSLAERRGTLKRLRPLGEETSLSPDAAEATNPPTPRRRATSPSMPCRPSPTLKPAPAASTPGSNPSPGRELIEKSIQETNKSHMEAANRLLQIQRAKTVPVVPAAKPAAASPPRETETSPASPLWSEASLPVTPDSSVAQTFFSVEDEDDEEGGDWVVTRAAVARQGVPDVYVSPSPKEEEERNGPKRMDSLDPQDPQDGAQGGEGRSPPRHGGNREEGRREERQRADSGREVREAKTGPTQVQQIQQVQYGQVGIARTVSFSRAKNAGRTPVAVKQPLRPRVVDVDARRSTVGCIEGA